MYIEVLIVGLMCALSSYIAHSCIAVYHDGVRPIMPELINKRMERADLAKKAYGLSFTFVLSVGISFTLATGLLNTWLLFLSTDVIGIYSKDRYKAIVYGLLWGIAMVIFNSFSQMGLELMPIEIIPSLQSLGSVVVYLFPLFPIVAIFNKFGKKAGAISGAVLLILGLLVKSFTSISPYMIVAIIGVGILYGIAIKKDIAEGAKGKAESALLPIYNMRITTIRKNLPLLAILGALISLSVHLSYLGGSEVSIFTIVAGESNKNFLYHSAYSEFLRALSFMPFIATTALTTGIYGIVGFYFVFAFAYLMPNPIVAMLVGAIVVVVEVVMLKKVALFLDRYSNLRSCSDAIRSSMNDFMEFALLIGAVLGSIKLGGGLALSITIALYYINDILGKPVLKIAAPAVALILTGIILNIASIFSIYIP